MAVCKYAVYNTLSV